MILVVGATGQLGGVITQMLLAKGKAVRILVRHNSPSEQLVKMGMATPMETLVKAGAQPVYGDLKDRASLDAACQSVNTVITTANSALRGGEDNIDTVDLDGNRNLLEAAQAAGAEHFVFVSTLRASPDSPVPFRAAKGKTEQALRESGMPYTILAPDAYMEVWVTMVVGMPVMQGRSVTLIEPASHRHSFVSAGDVAAFAMAAVDNPAARNQYLPIGGPQPLSWREIVATFEQVLARPISVIFVKPGEAIPGLPKSMWPLLASQETFESPIDMDNLARTFGVTPTRLETFVRRMVEPQPT